MPKNDVELEDPSYIVDIKNPVGVNNDDHSASIYECSQLHICMHCGFHWIANSKHVYSLQNTRVLADNAVCTLQC